MGGKLPICFVLTLALQILCEERGSHRRSPQRAQGPHNLEKEYDREQRQFNTLRTWDTIPWRNREHPEVSVVMERWWLA